MFQIGWLGHNDYTGFHKKQEHHKERRYVAIHEVHSLTTIAFAGLASATITMVGSVLAPCTMCNSLFAGAVGVTAISVSKYDGVLMKSV